MKVAQVVTFTETGVTRIVLDFCRNCERTWEGRDDDEHESFAVVSPLGVAHIGADYGETACGIDATGEDWWWQE